MSASPWIHMKDHRMSIGIHSQSGGIINLALLD